MLIGKKIKSYRQLKGLSQKKLGLICNLSEPAIRNYELGNRIPSGFHLEKIADALGIDPLALYDHKLDSYVDVIYALFEMEEDYNLILNNVNGSINVSFDNPTIKTYIEYWYNKKKLHAKGEITNADYNLWKATFREDIADYYKSKLNNNSLIEYKEIKYPNELTTHLIWTNLFNNLLYIRLDKTIQSELDNIASAYTSFNIESKYTLIMYILEDYIKYQIKVLNINLTQPIEFYINNISYPNNNLLDIEISTNSEILNVINLSIKNWKRNERYITVDNPITEAIYIFIENYQSNNQ